MESILNFLPAILPSFGSFDRCNFLISSGRRSWGLL